MMTAEEALQKLHEAVHVDPKKSSLYYDFCPEPECVVLTATLDHVCGEYDDEY